MKKFTVLITSLILTLLLVSCSSEDNTNKTERELRKGLTEAKIYVYLYKFGEIDKENKFLDKHYIYDKDGNISTKSQYDKIGKFTKNIYKYNQAYMVIESVEYNKDGTKGGYESIKYHNGDTIKAERISELYDEDGYVYKYEYKYDDKGNEIYYAKYTKFGDLDWETITENMYNEKNQLVQKIEISKSYERGNLKYTYKPESTSYIDENGNIISKEDKSDKKYNEKGQLIEEKQVGNIHKYKYNKKGLVEEELVCDERGEPLGLMMYEYK
jgi:YD repeat-containing protein